MPIYKEHDRLHWVYEGQPVIAPVPSRNGQAYRGTVTKAAGHHAQFTSRSGNFVRWYEVTDLFPDDGRVDAAKAKLHE